MGTTATKAPTRDRNAIDRLLEAAETLFGKHGIDGVSMRQIQIAAGSSNNFVVQYHFGGTAGLIQAILEKRMPAVDAQQAMLLAQMDAQDRGGDTRALVHALCRPLLDQMNSRNERSYARFITALLHSPGGVAHCRTLFHLTPMTVEILDRLHALHPHVPAPLLDQRLRLLSVMVYASVFNRLDGPGDPDADAHLIDDALDVAAAGLGVTPSPAAAFIS